MKELVVMYESEENNHKFKKMVTLPFNFIISDLFNLLLCKNYIYGYNIHKIGRSYYINKSLIYNENRSTIFLFYFKTRYIYKFKKIS